MEKTLLHAMLEATCPSRVMKNRKISYYTYDLHCMTLHVIARLVVWHNNGGEYEILAYMVVPDYQNVDVWLNRIESNHGIKWDL